MNKLEEEIFKAIDPFPVAMVNFNPDDLDEDNEYVIHAKAAAEVTKRYLDDCAKFLIENNTGSGPVAGILRKQYEDDYQNWLKENGITS